MTETCSRCGQEVRWGTRDGKLAYWHRDVVDHVPVFGTIITDEMKRRWQEELHKVRYLDDGTPYTTGEFDIMRDKDVQRRERRLATFRGKDPDAPPPPLPAPEMPQRDVDPESLPARSGMRQMVNLVNGTEGWTLYRLTESRGPYLGADGSILSISDRLVLGARGPDMVDGSFHLAVASWRDQKFDTGYTGTVSNGIAHVGPANSTDLKDWIKGKHEANP